ncbi:unnamed protein product [Lactuca virosa]|uniref:Uncharacterized protein n=1 Tax=Lactuca virosa TaxID=75947 RepID=A0AAU9N9K8_9ASTR|nr:unnamed protein product [Lactuca virosa]
MGGDGDLKVREGGGEEDMCGFIGGVDGGVLELLNLNGGLFVFLAGGRVDGGIFGAVESRSPELPSSEQNGRTKVLFSASISVRNPCSTSISLKSSEPSFSPPISLHRYNNHHRD